jgi:hypothetical protein
MTDKFKVLQLPTQPLQKHIPLELEMARDIARENVSSELLKARFEEAGYETKLDDDGDLFILGTWVNLRIILYPEVINSFKNNLTLTIIDVDNLFCGEIKCFIGDSNHSMYQDKNHVNNYGARKIVLELFK